jgi:hypothetical protein
MSLLMGTSSLAAWQEVIRTAEEDCAINLNKELESYLISLVMRYTDKPEVVQQILATAYFKAMEHKHLQRDAMLQNVGDQCLLFAGLFPRLADRRQVKLTYFVDLGRSAYASVSHGTNDLYETLATQFVLLMDVLRSIRTPMDLNPSEAYEQWQELGSRYALRFLHQQTNILPFIPR